MINKLTSTHFRAHSGRTIRISIVRLDPSLHFDRSLWPRNDKVADVRCSGKREAAPRRSSRFNYPSLRLALTPRPNNSVSKVNFGTHPFGDATSS